MPQYQSLDSRERGKLRLVGDQLIPVGSRGNPLPGNPVDVSNRGIALAGQPVSLGKCGIALTGKPVRLRDERVFRGIDRITFARQRLDLVTSFGQISFAYLDLCKSFVDQLCSDP